MQQLASLQSKLRETIRLLRGKYVSFDEAYSTYTAQYGENSVKVYEPFKISATIDPVSIILGRTTPLFYRDSKRTITGSLSSITIDAEQFYVLGRREPPDSKLVVWSVTEESEMELYDARVRVIPSRVHAAIFAVEGGNVFFSDLGSSSGSILAGETQKPEPFITLYATPRADVHRVTMDPKYRKPVAG